MNVEHGPLSSADAASQALTHWNHTHHIHLITCTLAEVGDLECDPRSHPKSDGNVGRDGNKGGGSTSTAESFHSEQGRVDLSARCECFVMAIVALQEIVVWLVSHHWFGASPKTNKMTILHWHFSVRLKKLEKRCLYFKARTSFTFVFWFNLLP